MRTPRHETALRYAELGIPVFPCVVGGKEPAAPRGFYAATTERARVDAWWLATDYNIGMVPDNAGWSVVDVDDPEAWAATDGQKPATYTVATPNGGLHLYYAGSLPSTASKLAPGIDTRGRGGYVLVPPSIVDGKEYRVLDARTPAPLPEWIAAKLTHTERPRPEAPVGIELDLPINIERTRSFLRGQWGAVEREGGDQHTYLMAQYALDAGLSVDGAFDAMQEWNARCYPPWSDGDLRTKIENAWKYRQNAPGAYALSEGTPISWQEYVSGLPPEPTPNFPAPITLRKARDVVYPPLEWVWKDRFIAGLPNLLTGDVKMGKTTLAKNLAVAVAAGIPLLGAETRQMPVVLLLGEDLAGPVRDDLMRIAQEMQTPDDTLDRVSFLSVVSDHIPGGSWLATIEDKHGTVSETGFMRHLIEADHIPRGCLFIIDPLAKFVLFNQHDPTSARALHDRFCEPLCRSLGITVLVNDHPSAASIERKDHAAGSKHFKAPFAAFATLLDKGKAGKTQHRLLDFREMRYAAGEAIDIYRGESPVFSLHPYGADDPKEVEMRVYEHVKERLDRGEHTGKDGHASYGPAEIGQALCIDEGQVKVAIDTCIRAEYLRWVARKGGGDGKIPAHLELGHVTPLAQPTRY